MTAWTIEQVVHFGPDDLVNGPDDLIKGGLVHFGFHDRAGRHFAVSHQGHFLGLIADGDRLAWTAAPERVFPGVPNITTPLEYPMYVDSLPDGSLVVSNFQSAHLYRIDPESMSARLLVDGHAHGMVDMGNCVVDEEGCIWVNEVTGCRLWRFDAAGRVVHVIGDGQPGFQRGVAAFGETRFGRIYDIRRGPGDTIYVLDSGNFALRAVAIGHREVVTIAGDGHPGYTGDGGDARDATFGSDPTARFDGPISLALDEEGNAFVGDRFNNVVRLIEAGTGIITTIAGSGTADGDRPNDPGEHDPRRLNLPQISSMDYFGGRLFVPTDLTAGRGDLAVLRRVFTTASA